MTRKDCSGTDERAQRRKVPLDLRGRMKGVREDKTVARNRSVSKVAFDDRYVVAESGAREVPFKLPERTARTQEHGLEVLFEGVGRHVTQRGRAVRGDEEPKASRVRSEVFERRIELACRQTLRAPAVSDAQRYTRRALADPGSDLEKRPGDVEGERIQGAALVSVEPALDAIRRSRKRAMLDVPGQRLQWGQLISGLQRAFTYSFHGRASTSDDSRDQRLHVSLIGRRN